MTSGIKSFGTKIGIGDGASPEVFANLPEGTVIPAFGGTKGQIDFSNHDSVDFKEFKPESLAEGNELPVEANHVPGNANVALFKAAYDNETTDNYKITLSNGDYYIFPGVCLGWSIDPSELDGRVKSSFNIKISGAITPYVS